MYEEELKKLTSAFKSKRNEAIEVLSEEMKAKPHEVMKTLLNAPSRAWKNSFDIFNQNPKIAYRTALELYPTQRERAKELIVYLGHGRMLKKIRIFYKLKKEIDLYIVEGIGVYYQDAYSEFLSGRMEKAIRKMKKLKIKGKKLREMRRKWIELRPELRKRGKDVPDIEPYLIDTDVGGAKELIKEMMDMLDEEDSVPKDGKEGDNKGGKSDV